MARVPCFCREMSKYIQIALDLLRERHDFLAFDRPPIGEEEIAIDEEDTWDSRKTA